MGTGDSLMERDLDGDFQALLRDVREPYGVLLVRVTDHYPSDIFLARDVGCILPSMSLIAGHALQPGSM